MTRRPLFGTDAFAPVERELDGREDPQEGYSTESEEPEEPLSLPPSSIAAIIDGLDIEGLPTPVELATIAASADEAPAHKKSLARTADSQLSKPGRAKRALKTEVHELQQMVDRMQAQVTGAACEIQELTRLVGQLVAKKQREEAAAAAIKQEQLEDEQEMERCLAMGDPALPPLGVAMLEQQLMMDERMLYEDRGMGRRDGTVESGEMDYPNVAAFPMCAVKEGSRRS